MAAMLPNFNEEYTGVLGKYSASKRKSNAWHGGA
jgi:hypothetical protein